MAITVGCFSILVLVSALAACGPSASSSSQLVSCNSLPPGVPTLDYPALDATNFPDDVGVLIFEAFDNYSASSFALTSASGNVQVTATAVPSPLPTGLSSTSPYYALAIPNLATKTQYTVNYTFTDSLCGQETLQLGTFTTQ
jgi:hypothetical protein